MQSSSEALTGFLAPYQTDAFASAAARRINCPEADCRRLLDTFANEAKTYWPLLSGHVRPGSRVLEVGSGLGFLSLWLARQGLDMVSVEPSAGPFTVFGALAEFIADFDAGPRPRVLRIGVERLTASEVGRFDLIYSFNVLEHIADLDAAFAAMATVLKPSGVMLHSCPNYTFPYEPHLGIPLVPGAPARTTLFFRKRIAAQWDVWTSLNFVTARRLQRLARDLHLVANLLPSQMTTQIQRLTDDRIFAARHFGGPLGRLMMTILKVAKRTGLLSLLKHAPPTLLTPMTILIRKSGANS